MAADGGAQRAREYLDVFASGDRDRLAEFFDEDIVWRVGGSHRLAGTYRGRDDLFDYFDRVAQETDGTLTLEPEAILSSDQHTVLYNRVRAERDGKQLDVTMAQAFKIGPDGRYTEFWALADRQGEVDEFWGS